MGEIKRWMAREYVAIPEGNKWMVEVPASWMRAPEKEFKIFVLASGHDAAMAEKDREIDRLKAENDVLRARSIVAGLKDDVRRMADGLWDVPPSTSDIVDEIGKRLRR